MSGVGLDQARQFALVRIGLGAYLAVSFARLIGDAELLAGRHLLAGSSSPFPNALAGLGAASLAYGLLAASAAAVLYASGRARRSLAVALWYIWACVIDLTPFVVIPSDAYIGWLLLATAFVPHGEALHGQAARPGFAIPRELIVGAWLLLALSYTASGLDKLASPSWKSGEALAIVLTSPISEPWAATFAESIPTALLTLATYATLALECLYAPLCVSRFTRPIAWVGAVGMHLATLCVLQIESVSIGMLVFHAWVFDHGWVRTARASVLAQRRLARGVGWTAQGMERT